MRVLTGPFEPDEAANLVFDDTSWLDDRPANVNLDGEFLYRVSGYEGFPVLYACRVGSRSKAKRRSTRSASASPVKKASIWG